MDREGFRNRMKQYKEARGQNPQLKYWEWKAQPAEEETPKYGGGTSNVQSTNTPLWRQKATPEQLEAFWTGDTQKMADIAEKQNQQVTYVSPEYTLDEVTVTAKDPNKYTELDLAKDIASFTPVIGDAMDIYDLGKSVYNGNYAQAAMLGAGLLLPNWLEKSGKFIWKGVKNIYGARKITKALDNSSLNYFNPITKDNNINYEPNVEKLGPTVDYQMADMRHFLKSRFNKWTKHYGYEPVPLDLSIQESLNQMKNRIIQHNTFVRGVRDPKQEMDYYFARDPSDPHAELMKQAYLSTVQSLEKQGLSNTAENRMKVAASQLVGQTGHGRAGFGYNTSRGALYTSNSLNTAGGYASYGYNAAGKVFKVQRPVDFSGDYHNWLLKGDFPLFNNNTLARHADDAYFFQDLPYLLKTGRSLKTDVMKQIDSSFPNYIQWKNDKLDLLNVQSSSSNTHHASLLQHTNDLFNRVFPEQKPFYKQNINSNNAVENIARYRALLELYNQLPSKPITRSGYQRTRAKQAADTYFRTYNYEKQQLLKSISGAQYQKNKLSELFQSPEYKNIRYSLLNKHDIDYESYEPNGPYKGIFTTEPKHHPKKNDNAYQHFIFVGTPGDYPVNIVEEIPQTVWEPLNSGTRAHVGESYKGLSRKSYADGGEVTGPPTYEDWQKALIKNNLWMHPDYYMSHSLNTATKALKQASAKLPGREDMPPVPVPAEIKGEFPQEWVMNNLYSVENPRKKGVTKKYAKMYDSRTLGAGVDVVSGHPELYDKAKRFGIEKELADEIAYEHIVHDDQVIRDNYADIYGKAAADTLSFGPRFLVAQARYQQGNVRKGWDEIHKALAKGDAKALKKAVLKVTPEDHDYRKKWVKNFNVYGNEPE